jgi:undecaprenyl-diphosphatase
MEKESEKQTKQAGASFLLLLAETGFLVLLFLLVFFVFVFAVKSLFITYHAFDSKIFLFLKQYVNERNTSAMLFFSVIGNFQFLLAANCVLIIYYLFYKKHKWYAVKIPAIALSSVSLMFFLKNVFERQRPQIPMLSPALGLSFPSGHAMSSVTFYGLLIYLILKSSLNLYLKTVIVLLLIITIFFIGLSRIYLRVHYPTDILGGYLAGLMWLIFSIKILSRAEAFTKARGIKIS